MIKAVIFDMDGVLVDSEPFWRRAMIKGFTGAGMDFTEEHCRTTTGMRLDEVIHHWHKKQPWEHKSTQQVEEDVITHLCELLLENGKAMPGVTEVLSFLSSGPYKVGLATSSCNRLIDTIMHKLQVKDFFHAIESAEHLPYGKPHPQVFLNCAVALNIQPEHCLVIEDSVNGVIAAKAARMKVIAIPEPENRHNPRFSLADITLNSLEELTESLLCNV